MLITRHNKAPRHICSTGASFKNVSLGGGGGGITNECGKLEKWDLLGGLDPENCCIFEPLELVFAIFRHNILQYILSGYRQRSKLCQGNTKTLILAKVFFPPFGLYFRHKRPSLGRGRGATWFTWGTNFGAGRTWSALSIIAVKEALRMQHRVKT
jgi:hypothetical protein